ncbi:MAG: 50S ribosomal protein L17 [Geobacteraceae bacterium]|nr:50S ribosomal protein L17 [Geobacteraceae bacterium]
MRHSKSGRRLGRTTSHRIAMFRNMVTSFLTHEKIVTTDAKAKELRPIAEKMITLGKQGDLHAVRQAASYIRDKQTVTKLFSVIAPRFKERPGGYTRIVKLGSRPGDTAQMSLIELVEEEMKAKSVKKTGKSAAKKETIKAAEAPIEASASQEPPVAEAAAAEEAAPDKE